MKEKKVYVPPSETHISGNNRERNRLLEVFRSGFNEADDSTRKRVLSLINRTGDRRMIPFFKELLESNDFSVRAYSAGALARLGDISGKGVLKSALRTGSVYLRLYAAQSLTHLNDYSGIDVLKDALNSKEWNVRLMGAEAVGYSNDSSLIDLLKKLSAGDPYNSVRASASAAILRLGDSSIIPTLHRFLDDVDTAVQNIAAEALAEHCDRTALKFFRKEFNLDDTYIKLHSARYMWMLGEDSVKAFMEKSLEDEDPFIRVYAAESLMIRRCR